MTASRPKFPNKGDFFTVLRARVNTYFEVEGRSPRDSPRLYLKAALIVGMYVTAYIQLVFLSMTIWQALFWGLLVAQGVVLIGFNVMQDGAHGGASDRPMINSVMARMLDFIGGSVYLWRYKHNVLHHTYPNIEDWDDDLETGGLLRFSPTQPLKKRHRYQHVYAPLTYSLLSLYWVFSDFAEFFSGKISGHAVPHRSRQELVLFLAAKFFFVAYALVLPLMLHTWWHVILAFVGIQLIAGFTLAIVFQLAHIVEGNTFPHPGKDGDIATEWAIHQLETTANFAPYNPVVNWYTGGLNHQIEHHLFPKISHVHYPAISHMVKQTCTEFGVPYREFPTVWAAVRAHLGLLRRLGAPTAEVQTIAA